MTLLGSTGSPIEGDSPSKPPMLSNYRLFPHQEPTLVMYRAAISSRSDDAECCCFPEGFNPLAVVAEMFVFGR